MNDILLFALLAVVCLGGIVLTALQLPGVWLALAAAVGYDWLHEWRRFGWKWLAALALIALVVEIFDALAGVIAAQKAGASRRASIGALIGGFAGMIAFSIPIPIPGLGAVAGGMVGCFVGALVGELSVANDLAKGARVGLFATVGKIVGLAAKMAATTGVAGAVVSIAAWSTFWRAPAL